MKLNKDQLDKIFELLPQSNTKIENFKLMQDIFDVKPIGYSNPLSQFMNSLKKGHYSDYYEKEMTLSKEIDVYDMKKFLANRLRNLLDKENTKPNLKQNKNGNMNKDYLTKRMISGYGNEPRRFSHDSSYSNESYVSTSNLPLKAINGELMSGYSTYDSEDSNSNSNENSMFENIDNAYSYTEDQQNGSKPGERQN